MMIMRMATAYTDSSLNLDPAHISTIDEYELLRNLYGRLVAYSTNGDLVPDLPERFEWKGNDLVFTFGTKAKTIDGHIISANDAALSLKRSMLFNRTGHGDLKLLLCPERTISALSDACPGISVQGSQLILRPAKPSLGPHLLAMLENADFSIIPEVSMERLGERPKIKSHRNTSGPFFVEKDSPDGAWTLRANPQHYLFHREAPTTIELVPAAYEQAFQLLQQGKLDLVPTPYVVAGKAADDVFANISNYSVHESVPIKVSLVVFTRKAVSKSTPQERFNAAKQVSAYLFNNFPVRGSQPTLEFFQGLSDGALSEEQRNQLRQLRDSNLPPSPHPTQFSIGVTPRVRALMTTEFGGRPEFKLMEIDRAPHLLPEEKRPDIYFMSNDSAWTESISLMGYNFGQHIFHLPNLDADKWLSDYILEENRENRMKKLQQLHFDLLKNAIIYPVRVAPYFAVASKAWTMPFNTLGTGTELWQIRRKH